MIFGCFGLENLKSSPSAGRLIAAPGVPRSAMGGRGWARMASAGAAFAVGAVAVIEIAGWLGPTVYEALVDELDATTARGVAGIVLRFDSQGGEAENVEVAVEAIRRTRERAVVVAVADPTATGAGYWLASQAERVLLSSKASTVGGVGVAIFHFDYSKYLAKAGIVVDAIVFGERKAEFAPWRALSDEARTWTQRRANEIGREFAGTVAAGRRLGRAAVEREEGRVLGASEAIRLGWADGFGDWGKAVEVARDDAARRAAGMTAEKLAAAMAAPVAGVNEKTEDSTMAMQMNEQQAAASRRAALEARGYSASNGKGVDLVAAADRWNARRAAGGERQAEAVTLDGALAAAVERMNEQEEKRKRAEQRFHGWRPDGDAA